MKPGIATKDDSIFSLNLLHFSALTTITNSIGLAAESWTLSMGTATQLSPFDGTSFGTRQVLNSLSTYYLVGMQYNFTYNTSGELTAVALPYGGKLRWDYRSFTYPGSRTLRALSAGNESSRLEL